MASIINHLKQSAAASTAATATTAAMTPTVTRTPPISVTNNTTLAAEWQTVNDEENMELMICDAKYGAMRAELLAQSA
jgi:hypothetical protein